MIDTHAHLYSEEFQGEYDQMMQRAFDAGVTDICVPAIDSTYAAGMYEIEAAYPGRVHLMMGLHPCYVKPETWQAELAFVEAELNRRSFVAIGEIGVDLYWDKTTLDIQQQAFRQQIQWAKARKLPINIHCREAFEPLFEVLEEQKSPELFGILHCFSGGVEEAQRAIDCNLKLGIGGVVTFKNGKIDQFLSQFPLTELVLETDAPYLAPAPYRGKRNESAYLVQVVEKLAQLYGLSTAAITTQTSANARAIFGI